MTNKKVKYGMITAIIYLCFILLHVLVDSLDKDSIGRELEPPLFWTLQLYCPIAFINSAYAFFTHDKERGISLLIHFVALIVVVLRFFPFGGLL